MTQEFIDLRNSILQRRYEEALEICDELEWMSQKGIRLKIESYIVRLMIILINNHVEKQLTKNTAVLIMWLIRRIQAWNTKEDKTSYYINVDEWQQVLEEGIFDAMYQSSAEVLNGQLSVSQLSDIVNKTEVLEVAQQLLNFTYNYKGEKLFSSIDKFLGDLPGGADLTQVT